MVTTTPTSISALRRLTITLISAIAVGLVLSFIAAVAAVVYGLGRDTSIDIPWLVDLQNGTSQLTFSLGSYFPATVVALSAVALPLVWALTLWLYPRNLASRS